MDVLRTPDDRFRDLPGYTFAPHYTEVPSGDAGVRLRIHHVDEGEELAAVVAVFVAARSTEVHS
jgi:haloalkane dehalogenase